MSVNACQFVAGTSIAYKAHDYSKLFLLKGYIYRFANLILFDCQNYILIQLFQVVISGCNLIRSDHPSTTKRGGACLYYKNYLPLRVLNIRFLKEYLNFDLKIADTSCNFIALFRSSSQSQNDFESFSYNFEMMLETLAQNIF